MPPLTEDPNEHLYEAIDRHLRGIRLNLDVLQAPVDGDERAAAIDELVLEADMLQSAVAEQAERLRG